MSAVSNVYHEKHNLLINDSTISTKVKIHGLSQKDKVGIAAERILANRPVYFISGSGSVCFPFSEKILDPVLEVIEQHNEKVLIETDEGLSSGGKGFVACKKVSLIKTDEKSYTNRRK